MSETIPEWARQAAKEVIREIFVDPLASMERPIARAIMAEREATELARDERAAKRRDQLATALSATKTFLRLICDEIGADDDETVVSIKAVGPSGSRELTSVSLRQILEQADQALNEEG